MEPNAGRRARVVAWDLPTRLFHWTLALLVLGQWASYEFAEAIGDVTLDLHRAGGLCVLTLLLWRILWGLAGPPASRFRTFVRSPSAALRYARDLAAHQPRRYLGHNPLGAYMVIALLLVLTAQACLGLFAVDDNDLTGGPLYRLVSEAANTRATVWHRRIFEYALLPLIAVHVAANVLYGVLRKEPLIEAMITGTKPLAAYEDDAPAVEPPAPYLARAGLLLILAASGMFGTIAALGGRF
jgi:cytochrome b